VDSPTGAVGPGQVIPSIYDRILGKSGYGPDFLNYMRLCGFTPQQCNAAKTNRDILRSPKFNYAVHKYLGMRDFAGKGSKIVMGATDPVSRGAAVGANYNHGPGTFVAGSELTFEQAQYSVTMAQILSTPCESTPIPWR
jgi:hypothetical protein